VATYGKRPGTDDYRGTGVDDGDSREPGSGVMSEQAHHPSDRTYLKVGSLLFILTAVEIALYFIEDALESEWSLYLLIASLIILSSIKFVLVVMYYMHLKWDDRIFTWFFLAGMFVAAAIILAMMAMYRYY
jgi:cytochrome c oxidase subunit IV